MRLGVIGLGERLGYLLNEGFRRVAPDLRVVGVIDPNVAGASVSLTKQERKTAVFHDSVAELVRKTRPDALAIGTRCALHAQYAIDAAKTGLPVFLEKPVAVTMAQAVALEEAFAESASDAVVSFPLRVSPLLAQVLDLIAEGATGRVEHILGVNYVPYGDVYFSSWYRDFSTTQGLFLQKATHDFDYLSLLAGAPIVRVAAMASKGRVYRDMRNFAEGVDAHFREDIGMPESGMNEDSSSALIEFASGAQGVYTQVFYSRGPAEARGATVSGLRGTLIFDWYRNSLRHVTHEPPSGREVESATGCAHFGGDIELARNFVEVVRGEAVSKSPIEAGLQSVYACLAAKESAETGRFVDVRQLGADFSGGPPPELEMAAAAGRP